MQRLDRGRSTGKGKIMNAGKCKIRGRGKIMDGEQAKVGRSTGKGKIIDGAQAKVRSGHR